MAGPKDSQLPTGVYLVGGWEHHKLATRIRLQQDYQHRLAILRMKPVSHKRDQGAINDSWNTRANGQLMVYLRNDSKHERKQSRLTDIVLFFEQC
jgi:hypothetical protein|eukprot:COSAG02_NODE_379_length_23528_cov_140.781510_3_plen_95_part_00